MSQITSNRNVSLLECNRKLLNPKFEGYQLKLLQTNSEASIIRTQFQLPASVDFPTLFLKDREAKPLSFSETKFNLDFNFAQEKLTLNCGNESESDLIFYIDTELNFVCIRSQDDGSIMLSILYSLKHLKSPEVNVTIPTVKLIYYNPTEFKAFFFICVGDSYLQFFTHHLITSQTTLVRTIKMPEISSTPDTERWTLLDTKYTPSQAHQGNDLNILALVSNPGFEKKRFIINAALLKIQEPLESIFATQEIGFEISSKLEGEEIPTTSFLTDSSQIFIASKKPFQNTTELSEKKAPTISLEQEIRPVPEIPYVWLQTSDDVTVYFSFNRPIELDTSKCILEDSKLKLSLDPHVTGFSSMHKNWYDSIKSNESYWTIENKRWLTFNLEKTNKGTRWPHLFQVDDNVMELLDPNELAEIRERMEKYTADLESDVKERYPLQQPFGSELEAEDLEGDEISFYFHDNTTGDLTKTYRSAGMSWLGLVLPTFPKNNPDLIMRHDIDALIFQVTPDAKLTHVSSFDAMGYVQASKKNRKMLTLTPTHNLMLIFDYKDQIFLYGKSMNPLHSPQAVITLPSDSAFQGMQLFNRTSLLLLTSDHLYLIDLKPMLS